MNLTLRQQVLRQTCDLNHLSKTTTVLDIYHEPHTPSDLRSPLPANNNHSVKHLP